VTIGEDKKPPYEAIIITNNLDPEWTQVFAYALAPPNPVQNIYLEKRILIFMDDNFRIHLPLVYK